MLLCSRDTVTPSSARSPSLPRQDRRQLTAEPGLQPISPSLTPTTDHMAPCPACASVRLPRRGPRCPGEARPPPPSEPVPSRDPRTTI